MFQFKIPSFLELSGTLEFLWNEYLLHTFVILARFFELSNKIFGFFGPLRGWQQGNLTFETPKESNSSIFRSCQPGKGPINPKIELDYQKIKPKDQSM